MKKIFSLIIAIVIAALSVLSAAAADYSRYKTEFSHTDYPGLQFENDFDDNLSVTGYTGSDSALVIPDTVYNKSVTRFEEKALKGNTVVKSIIMNDNMTNIRQRAFYQCTNLSHFYYSGNLQVISSYAFSYDAQLVSAFLRNTIVRQVANNSYMSCSNLEYVSLPDTLENIDGAAFEKTKVRKIVIPGGTTTVGARSFANNSNLQKFYAPASVTIIGSDVFYNSPNVTVYTPENSEMQKYCENNNINFVTLSEDDFPSRLLGDTNGDGELSINDVTFMQREIAGYKTDFLPDNCDFNGDCRFNINDATDVQLSLVGLK